VTSRCRGWSMATATGGRSWVDGWARGENPKGSRRDDGRGRAREAKKRSRGEDAIAWRSDRVCFDAPMDGETDIATRFTTRRRLAKSSRSTTLDSRSTLRRTSASRMISPSSRPSVCATRLPVSRRYVLSTRRRATSVAETGGVTRSIPEPVGERV